MKRFTEVSLRRWRAELCRTRSLIKDDRTPTGRGLLFALVADKLDLFFETAMLLDNCLQLCICRSILIFDLSTFRCFTRVSKVLNYAMLLGTMGIISRVEPFDRVITLLVVMDRSA